MSINLTLTNEATNENETNKELSHFDLVRGEFSRAFHCVLSPISTLISNIDVDSTFMTVGIEHQRHLQSINVDRPAINVNRSLYKVKTRETDHVRGQKARESVHS